VPPSQTVRMLSEMEAGDGSRETGEAVRAKETAGSMGSRRCDSATGIAKRRKSYNLPFPTLKGFVTKNFRPRVTLPGERP
jgi:hypothetical protein